MTVDCPCFVCKRTDCICAGMLSAMERQTCEGGNCQQDGCTYAAKHRGNSKTSTTQRNYPDTVKLGGAFQVREEGWKI